MKLCSSSSSSSSLQILLAGKHSSFHFPLSICVITSARLVSWLRLRKHEWSSWRQSANASVTAALCHAASFWAHHTVSINEIHQPDTFSLSRLCGWNPTLQNGATQLGECDLALLLSSGEGKEDLMCFVFFWFFHWKCFYWNGPKCNVNTSMQ